MFSVCLICIFNLASPLGITLPQTLPSITVDANGKTNVLIPIDLPQGGAIVPKLFLTYKSDNFNSYLGKGWSLSGLESIYISSSSNTNEQEFYSSMVGKLIDISGNKTEFKSKIESYSKIIPSSPPDCGNSPCSWLLITKEGIRFKFGSSTNSRLNQAFKPEIKEWLLDRVEDANGNGYDIFYTIDNDSGFSYPDKILYLDRVIQFHLANRADINQEYRNNLTVGMNKIITGVSITAAGENYKNYNFFYSQGIDKISLLNKISQTGFKDLDINYNNSPNLLTKVSNIPTSTNVNFKVPFFNGGKCEEVKNHCICTAIPGCAAAAVQASLGLINPQEECATGTIQLGDLCTNGMQTGPFTVMGDVTGDGKSDIIKIVGGVNDNHIQVLRLNETGGTDSGLSPSISLRVNSLITLADVNGDGRQEVLYAEDQGHNLKVAYYNLTTGSYSNIDSIPNIVVDTLDYNPNDIKLYSRNFTSDLNGDKRSDFISTYEENGKTKLKIYTSTGTGFNNSFIINVPSIGTENTQRFFLDTNGDGSPEWVQMQNENPTYLKISTLNLTSKTAITKDINFDLSAGTGKVTNTKNISFTDINGDGKIDLTAVLDDGRISVVLGNEFGFSNASLSTLSVPPQYLPNGDNSFQDLQNNVNYSDINGDGKDDLVFSKNGNLYISYSNGKGFTSINDIKPFSGAFQLADINADGKSDIIGMKLTEKPKTPIFSFQAFSIDSGTPIEYTGNADLIVESSTKAPQGIIEKISNNEGKTVTVDYTHIRDIPGAVLPNTGTYPVLPSLNSEYLVTTVVTEDGSGLPASKEVYEYETKKIHSGNKEFSGNLGFAKVTKTNYLLTSGGEVLINKIVTELNQDSIISSASVSKQTITNEIGGVQQIYNITYEKGLTANGTSYFREKTISNSIYENSQFLLNNTRTKTYDSFGNITNEISNIGGKIEETIQTFNPDTNLWLLERVSHSEHKKEGVLLENINYTHNGLNIETSSVEIEPGKWATTSFTYDSIGRLISETDPVGKTLNYTYDTYSNANSVSNQTGFSINYEYDSVTGSVKKQKGLNGEETEFQYDYYGRITEIKKPGAIDWSEKFIYSDVPNDRYVEKRSKTSFINGYLPIAPLALIGTSGYTWSREYQNEAGDKIKTQSSSKDGKIIQVDYIYDSKGNLVKESNPYLLGEQTPMFTVIQYGVNDRIESKTFPNGKTNTYSMSNLVYSDQLTNRYTITSKRDLEGRYTEIAHGNIKKKYEYYPSGKVKKIYDTVNNTLEYAYDRRGNITSTNTINTGKSNYTYDTKGNLISKKDARGKLIEYFYDSFSRLIKIKSSDEVIEYIYDEPGENTLGRLTSIIDSSGITKYFYDKEGNRIKTIRKIDDLVIQFQNRYDSKNRLIQRVYPDGTIASYYYTEDGLHKITISTADGKVNNETLVEFIRDKANSKLIKKYGNGVVTEIEYDPISNLELSTKTLTARQSVEEHKIYKYDSNKNILEILDLVKPAKSQTFNYDSFNRLTKATGIYGEETYIYNDNGNLLKKGETNYSYTNNSHPHAVTSVQKPHETIQYEYDKSGNLAKKNNDSFKHSAMGRLTEINNSDGRTFNYFYNHLGNRVKKVNRSSSEVTYYFEDGLYEIHKSPSKSDEHTIYFLDGNLPIAQWTRTDAVLPNINAISTPLIENLELPLNYMSIILALLILYFTRNLIESKKEKFIFSLKLSFTFFILVTCSGSDKKAFPFAVLALNQGVNSETPGIGGNPSSGSSSGSQFGGGVSSAGTPVTGFYFLHRNYLDSVTMLTDAKGEMVSGMDLATGKSVIDYKPYGEIDRKNSDGPDIFRYKYTGQEEDRETGLYYYKARYYDPEIARFIEPDTYQNPNSLFGLNSYMYVEGNPIKYNDPSGYWKLSHITKGRWGKTFKRIVHMWNQHLPKVTDNNGDRRYIRGFLLCELKPGGRCAPDPNSRPVTPIEDPDFGDYGDNGNSDTHSPFGCIDCNEAEFTEAGDEISEWGETYEVTQGSVIYNHDRINLHTGGRPVSFDNAGLVPNYVYPDLDSNLYAHFYRDVDLYGNNLKTVVVRFYDTNSFPFDICEMNTNNCIAPGQRIFINSRWYLNVDRQYARYYTYMVYSYAPAQNGNGYILGRRAPYRLTPLERIY
jgi:RHS repeat-associated protein